MLVYDNVLWWSMSAGLSGLGMALLYPNLSAAVGPPDAAKACTISVIGTRKLPAA